MKIVYIVNDKKQLRFKVGEYYDTEYLGALIEFLWEDWYIHYEDKMFFDGVDWVECSPPDESIVAKEIADFEASYVILDIDFDTPE